MLYLNRFKGFLKYFFIFFIVINFISIVKADEILQIIDNNNILVENEKNDEERLFISKIKFTGNKKVDSKELINYISTKEKTELNKDLIEQDLNALKEFYGKIGYKNATIKYRTEKNVNVKTDDKLDNANVVRLVFIIKEGKPLKIKNITINGNKNFSALELKRHLFSKEKAFWRFLSNKTIFVNETKDINKALLSDFYYNKGYLDFKIINYKEEVIDDFNVNLSIDVDEGDIYRIGKFEIFTKESNLDLEKLEKLIILKNNNVFAINDVRESVAIIENTLKDEGLLFLNVDPQILPDSYNHTVDIYFNIIKGAKKYINSIKIHGNYHTYDYLIRDIININEGNIFNDEEIEKIKRRLVNSGYFTESTIDMVENTKNKYDLTLNVKENKNNHIGVNFGYSSNQYFTLGLELVNGNLFGKGYSLNFNLDFSRYIKTFSFGFGKNHIFNTNMYGGFDVYVVKDKSSKNSNTSINYDVDKNSLDFFARYNISEDLTHKLYYNIAQQQLKNVAIDYKGVLNEDKELISIVGNTLSYDTRDNIQRPKTGFFASIDLNGAGIGGDKRYIETSLKLNKYFNIYKGLVWKIEGQGGYIRSFGGKKLYPTDGFRLGGSSFKGFEIGGIGPRIKDSDGNAKDGISAGGTKYAIFNTELQFPFPFVPEETGLYLSLFYNLGILTGVEKNNNVLNYYDKIYDSKSWRSAYGISLIFATPMGIDISFEFSNPIKYDKQDSVEHFRFNLGKYF